MNASLLCCLAVLSAAADDATEPVYTLRPEFAAAIRGQSPGYAADPFLSGPALPPGMTLVPDYTAGMPLPPQAGSFAPANPANIPNLIPAPPGTVSGFAYGYDNAPTYFPGWVARHAIGVLPDSDASRGLGEMGIFESDSELRHIAPVTPDLILTAAPQFSTRGWDGPDGTPSHPGARRVDLPGSVYRFGVDLTASTQPNESLSLQLGFTPSINSDFEQNATRDAYNWDGRGIVLYRVQPALTLGVGVLYWDRVHDRVLPYAGFIFTPNEWTEYHLIFPNPRVSFLLGAPRGVKVWFYTRGEYHVEAYQIEQEDAGPGPSFTDKIELEDWRVLLGLRTRNPRGVGTFIEAGWVFGRDVEFLHTSRDFDLSSGFITRAGWQF